MASGTCTCDESVALRGRLNLTTRAYAECCAHRRKLIRDADLVRAERDYMLAQLDASEVIQMRKHLAAEWEAQHLGALPVEQQSDEDSIF